MKAMALPPTPILEWRKVAAAVDEEIGVGEEGNIKIAQIT